MKHKGWIALDIDGTITDSADSVPLEVVDYLEKLAKEGWKILFITGRTFSFGHSALKAFSFPYYFGVQHGADVIEMPSKKLFSRSYLTEKALPWIEEACKDEKEDFLIYAGYELGDFCYYRPKKFSKPILKYIEIIKKLSHETWKPLESFDFKTPLSFPLIKGIGPREEMLRINKRLSQHSELHVTTIKDPILKEEDLYLNLITHAEATKGKALKKIISTYGEHGIVIAAGDDLNDLSMLEVADVAIAMETGPEELIKQADIVASSAKKLGIIKALEKAIYG